MKRKEIIAITLGIMCFILTYMISIQIKTVKETNSTAIQTMRENELRNEVLKWKERFDSANEKNADLESKLEEYRSNVAESNESADIIRKELYDAKLLLGLVQVKGDGVIVTVNDSNTPATSLLNPEDEVLHDGDLLSIINELRAAGAEAISINGQRITSFSEIRCVGPVVVINKERVAAPFVIKAIGRPEYLESSLNIKGGIVDILKSYNIRIDVKKANNIIIEKYEGVFNLKYATADE